MANPTRSLSLGVIALLFFTLPLGAQPAAPQIVSLDFPGQLNVGRSAVGWVRYQSPAPPARLQLDVVDGRFVRHDVTLDAGGTSGRVRFSLRCRDYAQTVVLRAVLWDEAGRRSDPQLLRFNCGQPPRYNLSQELARALPTTAHLRLNLFILDDGVTALAEGAQPGDSPLWSRPAPQVLQALERTVLPALTGVWDQCGVGFSLGQVRVMHPDRLPLANGTLAQQLFTDYQGERVIFHGAQAGEVLRQAKLVLAGRLAEEGTLLGPDDLVVFVVGSRILSSFGGKRVDIEGFGEINEPRYALVRWGAVYPQGPAGFFLPRQMVATLAHEIGHNLGLEHPGNDGLPDTVPDPLNLMKGSGVAPEPRARLLASQCQRVSGTVTQIQARLAAAPARSAQAVASPVPPAGEGSSSARVAWVNLSEGQRLRGSVALEVEASGFADLKAFGFAEFAYSTDGERFVQIALDRTPGDGFKATWDTTALPNGRYLVRAAVTDAQRVKASVAVWVEVKN